MTNEIISEGLVIQKQLEIETKQVDFIQKIALAIERAGYTGASWSIKIQIGPPKYDSSSKGWHHQSMETELTLTDSEAKHLLFTQLNIRRFKLHKTQMKFDQL